MRLHRITPAVILGTVVSALAACRSDSVSSPYSAQVMSAVLQSAGVSVLVVDDDRADCRDADFTSIQAAVDAAAPRSTILVCAGTYREWVVITSNELRLLATGKPGDVVLDGQHLPGSACSPTSTTAFQCAGVELRNAHGTLIEGFLVRRYWEAGIWLRMGSSGNTIRKNVTTGSHHDGIQVVGSNDNLIEHNVAVDHLAANACGVNVAAGSQRNVVRHNRLVNNEWGIQIAGGALDNVISRNKAGRNRGNGIRNVGASGTIIEENHAFRNGFAPSALTGATAGGIRLASGAGIVVRENHAFGNLLVDLLNEAATATFQDNRCGTSSPSGLCERDEDDEEEPE